MPEAWKTTTGDPSVVVAVIDSGVDLTHPDLDGVTVVDPRNVVWNNTDVADDVGHGTHVTGTILAETDNGVGIAGIAPGSRLMPIKVADPDGFISLSDVLDAVDWAREHGADVINLSLGGILQPRAGRPRRSPRSPPRATPGSSRSPPRATTGRRSGSTRRPSGASCR